VLRQRRPAAAGTGTSPFMTSAEAAAALGRYQRAHPGPRDGLRQVIEKAAGHPAGQLPMSELLPGLDPQELSVPRPVTAADVRCTQEPSARQAPPRVAGNRRSRSPRQTAVSGACPDPLDCLSPLAITATARLPSPTTLLAGHESTGYVPGRVTDVAS